ncbi:PP2C family serine/threonine-protein phosphatase [Flavonifractor sp. An100]|uniref:PP2C family protein-serine/threonine phosphatase n=1 Tax=Flavonifractor sp. An100 TaxID=1965538 RepID=UPI000B389EE7|nr:PP2C family serine/threonine-protein phosphatase [Flavonifractor sp. An100]OUQ77270.1 hypothetical protein B5E43_10595 [Flavonifractor sp. An100]
MRGRYYDGISLRNRRPTNMDSLLVKERTIAGEWICLAVVCDGVGSLESGALAASQAVQQLGAWLNGLEDISRAGLNLRQAVLRINEQIIDQARNLGIRTATTLSALLLTGGRYYIVHAGDSRIYSWGEEGLRQLTRDDITQEGKLSECIGRSSRPSLFYSEGESEKRIFLLCSDGLYKRMEPDYLSRQLERADRGEFRKAMEHLVEYVVDRGEPDNISVAIVKSRG